MTGVQKMDITFLLSDEITNHENWQFIGKILDQLDLQIYFLVNRQAGIWPKSLHVLQNGFLWIKVENASRAQQKIYARASSSNNIIKYPVCLFYIYFVSLRLHHQQMKKQKILDFAKIVVINSFTNILAIWRNSKKIQFSVC